MLNSTKTWEEEWEKTNAKNKLIDLMFTNKPSVVLSLEGAILQFISDLRKRDMEALIGMLPKNKLGHINQEGLCDDCGYKICRCYQTNSIIDTFKKIIKDYYENL